MKHRIDRSRKLPYIFTREETVHNGEQTEFGRIEFNLIEVTTICAVLNLPTYSNNLKLVPKQSRFCLYGTKWINDLEWSVAVGIANISGTEFARRLTLCIHEVSKHYLYSRVKFLSVGWRISFLTLRTTQRTKGIAFIVTRYWIGADCALTAQQCRSSHVSDTH